MSRHEVYEDITRVLGQVPAFFEGLPDSTLGLEWRLCRCAAERIADSPATWGVCFGGMRIQFDEMKAESHHACELTTEAPAAAARRG